MMAIFYILIAIIFGVACWKVAKLLGWNAILANKKDNQYQGVLFAVVGVLFFDFVLYCFIDFSDVMLPEASSVEGEKYDLLYNITMIMILIVFFVTQLLLFYFAYRYRGIRDKKASFFHDSRKLEIIWTMVPTCVLSVLVIYGLFVWNDMMDASKAEDPLVVEVYAKQFSWEARYPGKDNELGLANVRNIKGINTMGVDMTDKYALDDIPVRELHLPKGRKVVFKFRSQDVLHSAYMPHFRAQMNCVPGMVTQFGFTPKFTTKEMRKKPATKDKVANINTLRAAKGEDPYEFDYVLLCNKICGSSHYNMQMKIVVEEEEEFNAWLGEQKTISQLIQ